MNYVKVFLKDYNVKKFLTSSHSSSCFKNTFIFYERKESRGSSLSSRAHSDWLILSKTCCHWLIINGTRSDWFISSRNIDNVQIDWSICRSGCSSKIIVSYKGECGNNSLGIIRWFLIFGQEIPSMIPRKTSKFFNPIIFQSWDIWL